jgi:hypothetical protein
VKCDKANCSGYSLPYANNVIELFVTSTNNSFKQVLNTEIYSCASQLTHTCQECDNNINVTYNPVFGNFVIVGLATDQNNPLKDLGHIPSEINLNSSTYELKLLFDHPARHFYSIVRCSDDNYIILNDTSKMEYSMKYEDIEDKNYNFKALVYVKKLTKIKSEPSPKRRRNDGFKYALMQNSLCRKVNGITEEYHFLCTFNSFLHGLIASYDLFKSCADYINQNRNKFIYFDTLLKLIQIKSAKEAEQFWILHIINNVPKTNPYSNGTHPFECIGQNANKISFKMFWNLDDMLSTLLKGFESYTNDSKCDCGYKRTRRFLSLRISFANTSHFEEMLKNSLRLQYENQTFICPKCNKQNKSVLSLNNIIIMRLRISTTSPDDVVEISLDSIPCSIVIDNNSYDFMFCLNYKNGNHFNTFVYNNGDYIYLNDLPHEEERISFQDLSNWKINPLFLVFISKS